ncbi:MAG TPA: hypothetical protein VLS89_09285 [Candidatus Nanopelagicales bacterium]|nr:hypothetical protein [Candidatus Nanopelagicales bacterium]
MANPKSLLPECGLYLTTRPLPGNEEKVPAGILVSFHNHPDSGLPTVTVPDHNIHNRWHFHGPSISFRGLTWAETLQKLPPEGFYILRKELSFDGGKWPRNTLVQLGYNQAGMPILFIARVRARLDENDLHFSDKGVGIKREQLNILESVTIYQEQDGGAGGHAPDHAHSH